MINPGPEDLFCEQQEVTGVSSSQCFHKYTKVSNTVRAHRVTGACGSTRLHLSASWCHRPGGQVSGGTRQLGHPHSPVRKQFILEKHSLKTAQYLPRISGWAEHRCYRVKSRNRFLQWRSYTSLTYTTLTSHLSLGHVGSADVSVSRL